MEIKTKYDIGERLCFIQDNTIRKKVITGLKIVVSSTNESDGSVEWYIMYKMNTGNNTYGDHDVNENDLYKTEKDIVDYLLEHVDKSEK